MGYSHLSNVAQRFANTLVMMFLMSFLEADAAALQEEAGSIPLLKAWLEHRKGLSESS